MKNTFRSIVYVITRSKLLIISFISLVILMAVITGANMAGGSTSGLYLGGASISFMFPIVIVGVAVGIVCCSDMKDKVSNYEILSGHSREEFYFARFICAVVLASVLGFILSFIPMIYGNLFYGWGDKLIFSEVLIRQLLFIFPLLRLSAFFVCVSFVVRNDLIMTAAGFAMGLITPIMLSLFSEASDSFFISIYNFNYLMDFNKWEIYNVASDGIVKYMTGVSTVTPEMVTGTILISLFMTVVYMLLGYGLFRRSDIE